MTDFLVLAFVFLAAGVVAVPIASRLGLGSVLGYLIAGVAISPILAALQVDVVAIQHFAEFGVVMMLFLVGLELEPKMLWQMRHRLLGLGGLQVGVTTALVMGVAMVFGLSWSVALACGLVLALSSTAIVLQTLNEKGLMKSDGGQASFSVLLFQDIAVIPMLALIPLLALPELADVGGHVVAGHGAESVAEAAHGETHGEDHGGGHGMNINLVENLPAWQAALATIAAIAGVIMGGAYLTTPVFRFVEMANLRELFVATALLFVIGIALLMTLVGLSPALGTFLAGVVLANSEYRHELESDIDPFRGLLLGLFFMTVGAAVNFGLLFGSFGTFLGLTLGLMAIKSAVLFGLARIFKLKGGDKYLFGLGLAQAGEFGFVLLSFTVANNVLPPVVADQLLLVVALSMMLTPLLFIFHEKVILPRMAGETEQEPDEIDETGQIIIAGHGRFGGVVNRMMRAAGYSTTVLDHSSVQLERLRRFGVKVFFGDATRPDLLHAAGLREARLLVVAIDQRDAATELVRHVRHEHPKLGIVARAVDRHHVYELYAAGATHIVRDTFDSAVRAGRSAYEELGMHAFDAEMLAQAFVDDDKATLLTLASVYDPKIPAYENEEYLEKLKEVASQRDDILSGNGKAFHVRTDRGWTPPSREDLDAEQEADKT
ncbi:Glutathione-regulated potassium-efflux system protein KefC [Shimia sp. SK013]|uniref:cation:proton antiporter domain-containing protein n=1 Tax=Shimia sp. SK013 TaxID=1389006 RepID=UPI0006B4069A|nr:cation:proton antiporter [Shimia sp. SK013]KPA21430.1 Glutathione-regulated potassium-efflux system protein KefC [Shimia sp. SK013]